MSENGSPKVSALFTPKEVVCGLKSGSREKCLELLAKRLADSDAIPDAGEAVKAVLAREELGSTILAPGLAVPHARMDGIEGTFIAVATSSDGIAFGEKASEHVQLVVMILTGASAPGAYLQVLAAVARAFASESIVRRVAQLDTPEKVWAFFDKGAGALPEFVVASDMMTTDLLTLRNTDTLAAAIDFFCRHRVSEIPILDGDGDFAGVVTQEEILKISMPEYILWLEDLSPILQFEPFGETLKDEHITRIAEIMSDRYISVSEDTPAIHVARELMRREVGQVYVMRGRKLVGVISLSHLLGRIFRG